MTEPGRQFQLNPDITFLNHGSFGACPGPVFEVYQGWQRQLEQEPVDFMLRRAPDLLAEARRALGAFVGADADDLVFVTNATTGVNVVARSLDLGPGDTVLATDHEYGACDRVWRFVCRRRGASYRHLEVGAPVTEPAALVDLITAALREAPPRVLFVSHITSPTALVLPIAQVCARARDRGVITVVDGAHAPGQLDLDLEAIGADFYTGNCHKWLCAPKGAAFLYARRDVQGLLSPLVVSWGWESEIPGPSRFVDEQQWTGTRDLSAFLTVPAAIEFQARHDWPSVRVRCHGLVRRARRGLLDLPGVEPLHPDDDAWYAQMEAVVLPRCDPIRLNRRLFDDHHVEVPGIAWAGRSLLRVSAQAYNDADDVDRLLAVLPEALAAEAS